MRPQAAGNKRETQRKELSWGVGLELISKEQWPSEQRITMKKANWKLRLEGRGKKGQAACDTKKNVVGVGRN